MTPTMNTKASRTSAKDKPIVEVAEAFLTEKSGAGGRRGVLLIRMPLDTATKMGFSDTAENHVSHLPCVATALLLSSTEIAVIAQTTFGREQAEAVVNNLARYRDLDLEKFVLKKQTARSKFASEMRNRFIKELELRKNRAGAGVFRMQLANGQ